MKILSARKGFLADHSSTSYEFLAIDRPLDSGARARVSSLSRRVSPTRRRVSFVYNVEGYGIPGGWQPLMRDYYDVMYSESYDWWTLAMAFNAPKEQQEALQQYAFDGVDEHGVDVATHDSRVIVTISCRLDAGFLAHSGDFYDAFDEEEEEEEEGGPGATYESGDALLDLLGAVRQQLMAGDYRALYAVWETYGWEEAEETDDEEEEAEAPPIPPDRPTGGRIVEQFESVLLPPE